MYYKVRGLPDVDFGTRGNGRYYGAVSYGNKQTYCTTYKRCNALWVETSHKQFCDLGVHNRANILVAGTEKFGSTKFPRPAINFCEHWIYRCVNYPYTCIGGVYGQPTKANQFVFFREPVTQAYVIQVINHPVFDVDAAQRDAWHEMQPEFAGKVSLLNFIYELKDFKDIVKYLVKPQRILANLTSGLRNLWAGPNKEASLKRLDFSKPAAELHLINEFAIKPLVNDVISIHLQLKDMIDTLQSQFVNEGAAGNTRYFSLHQVNEETLSYPLGCSYCSGTRDETIFTAGMKYTYSYQVRTFLDALRSYWGLKFTAEVIWNSLPFSFLLDYIYTVGRSIARMEHDPNVALNVADYWESLLTLRQSGRYIKTSDMHSPLMIDFSFREGTPLVAGTESSFYSREVRLPNKGASLPRLKMPSSRQALNVVALLRCIV